MLNWLELEILYAVDEDNIEDERDDVLEQIRRKQSGETKYKRDIGFFNIVADPIRALSPGYLMAKDGTKVYYTLIIFNSGDTVSAVGKPERVYKRIVEYVEELQRDNEEESKG